MHDSHRGFSEVKETVADFSASLRQPSVVTAGEGVLRVPLAFELRLFQGKLAVQAFDPSAEYEKKQSKEALPPEYEKMVSLFRAKIHLAYPDTAEHVGELVEFVAIWKRRLDGSLLPEALPHLDHTEENVRLLYESLQRRHGELVEEIAGAQPR